MKTIKRATQKEKNVLLYMSRKNIRKKPIKSLNIRKNKGGIHMSGHSKWHNMNNSFLTATRLSKNKSMF